MAGGSQLCLSVSFGLVVHTLPGKVQTYMAAGRPIIAAASGETQNVIADAKCGIACASEDFISLAKNVDYISKNKDLLKDYATNARQYYDENYRQEKFFKDIINVMEVCVESYNK